MLAHRMLRLGIPVTLVLLLGLAGCSDSPAPDPGPTPVTLIIPDGFPPLDIPADNPTTVEGIDLGRRLFFDPILSGDGTLACAGCHRPELSFSDPRRFSLGIDGTAGTRNAPGLANTGGNPDQFWDGRDSTLEAQALRPVPDETEMHLPWSEAVEKLQNHPAYRALFAAAFPGQAITADLVTMAIAQFERTLISADSEYDRWKRGDATFTAAERRGFDLFFNEIGDCFHCHGPPLFTDQSYRNNGLDANPADPGREAVTGNPGDHGRFRSPSLRNVGVTAPYMHDGRFATLEDAIRHYNDTKVSLSVDPLMLGRKTMTEEQIADIAAFLRTLTDEAFLADPAHRPPGPPPPR
jgi:cytochrome c peroxidase